MTHDHSPAVGAPIAGETPLADWVSRHGAVWDMSVRSESVPGHGTAVELALTLSAQCRGRCRTDPTCPQCRGTQERLREIARAVIPEGVTHWFDPLEPSFHLRRAAVWAPEVEATVVLRSANPGGPPDSALRQSIRQRLLGLGVQERK